MFNQIENLAYEMRLFGIKSNIERRCQEAVADSYHPSEVIRLLLEDEKMARKQAAAKRLISRAKFRSNCQLEDWDLSYDRGLSKVKLKELSNLIFYNKNENLIIVGKTGVGKTHIAIALGNRICEEADSTLFFSVNLLFEELKSEKIAGRYLKLIKKMTKTKALILDDFGLRNYSHDEATALLEVLEERYGKGVTILTSQVSPKGWLSLFEDQVIGEAIVDRLCNPASIVELNGESYRRRKKKS